MVSSDLTMISNSTDKNQNHNLLPFKWSHWDGILICYFLCIGFIYFRYFTFLPDRIPTCLHSDSAASAWISYKSEGWLLFGLPSLLWFFLSGISLLKSSDKTVWQRNIREQTMVKLRGFLPFTIGIFITVNIFGPLVLSISPCITLTLSLSFLLISIFLGLRWIQKMIPSDLRAHYKYGLIYHNPNDASVWVSRISGLGWTLNFAHKKAYVWLIVLLLPIFLVILFTLID